MFTHTLIEKPHSYRSRLKPVLNKHKSLFFRTLSCTQVAVSKNSQKQHFVTYFTLYSSEYCKKGRKRGKIISSLTYVPSRFDLMSLVFSVNVVDCLCLFCGKILVCQWRWLNTSYLQILQKHQYICFWLNYFPRNTNILSNSDARFRKNMSFVVA